MMTWEMLLLCMIYKKVVIPLISLVLKGHCEQVYGINEFIGSCINVMTKFLQNVLLLNY